MKKSILVVDDEPLVVKFIERVLQRSGFSVLTATAPDEALALCQDLSVPVDVVLCDVMMPKMNGVQLGAQILEIRPTVQLILMSGYSDLDARRMMAGSRTVAFLKKPFSMATLLTAVGGLHGSNAEPSAFTDVA